MYHTWTTFAKRSDNVSNGQARRFFDLPGAPGWRMSCVIAVICMEHKQAPKRTGLCVAARVVWKN